MPPKADGEPKSKLAPDTPVAPSVRKLAAESGVEPSTVPGSGKDGRVTKGDMLAAIERAAARRRRLRTGGRDSGARAVAAGRCRRAKSA